MKQCWVNEDKLPQKLLVITSPKISKQIQVIDGYNQNNIDALYQWNEYIEGVKSYISNPVIAWDYNNKYPHFPNGAVHLRDFGYDVAFIVKTNQNTNKNYVYVFKIDLKPQEFGLKVPPTLEENRDDIVSRIITETINNYLKRNILLVS